MEGRAHGMMMSARRRPLPRKSWFMTSAMATPRMISSATEAKLNTMVWTTAFRKYLSCVKRK